MARNLSYCNPLTEGVAGMSRRENEGMRREKRGREVYVCVTYRKKQTKGTKENSNNNNNCIERCSSNFFQSPYCAANCFQHLTLKWPRCSRAQITCYISSAYRVQHVVCHVVRRDSSAVKFDRVEIAFILALEKRGLSEFDR